MKTAHTPSSSDQTMAQLLADIEQISCAGFSERDRLKVINADLLAALAVIANSEQLKTGSFVCDFETLQSVARTAIARATKE